ncbi:MAG: pirin family protein [Alphaproteobacteria bacterium]|nr:pirin family protein [Alphaproteobacteria bacterium]
MLTIRRAAERGHTKLVWLDSRHTFSFGDYVDRRHSGFRALRVINEDRVAPGGGFAEHGHRDMEIVTYVVAGALEHKDSLGNGSAIRPGDVQRMSAGVGIRHSEFNPSTDDQVQLLQIWIVPESQGLKASYAQRSFDPESRRNRFCLVASHDGRDESVVIHQDAAIFAATIGPDAIVSHVLAPSRFGWLQVVTGGVEVNGQRLSPGDGVGISGERTLRFRGLGDGEVLLFDLA